MKRRILAKLRGCAGESIGETLIALLISSLALLMLAGAITTATRVVTLSNQKMTDYYQKDAALTERGTALGEITVSIQEGGSEVQTFSGVTYGNDAFAGSGVVSYVLAEGES